MGELSEFTAADRAVIDPNGAPQKRRSMAWIGELDAAIGLGDSNSSNTSEVECPHCTGMNSDLWQYDAGGWKNSAEIACEHCGKPLTVTVETVKTFTLAKREA